MLRDGIDPLAFTCAAFLSYTDVITGLVSLRETPAAFKALQTEREKSKILVKPGG